MRPSSKLQPLLAVNDGAQRWWSSSGISNVNNLGSFGVGLRFVGDDASLW